MDLLIWFLINPLVSVTLLADSFKLYQKINYYTKVVT